MTDELLDKIRWAVALRQSTLATLHLEQEDVVQDVCLGLVRRPLQEGLPGAWLWVNLRNRVKDAIRTHSIVPRGGGSTGERNRFRLMASREGLDLFDPTSPAPSYEPWLAKHVSTLPPRDQRILHEAYVEGRSSLEIAPRLGISNTRVNQLHRRALSALRVSMGVS